MRIVVARDNVPFRVMASGKLIAEDGLLSLLFYLATPRFIIASIGPTPGSVMGFDLKFYNDKQWIIFHSFPTVDPKDIPYIIRNITEKDKTRLRNFFVF